MLIRRPVADVFEALVDPEITSHFWFTRGSARLEAGHQVRWEWEMYGVSAQVDVLAVERDQHILVQWPDGDGSSTVEWRFTPRGPNQTLVVVENRGFTGDADTVAAKALDSTGGFNLLLAGLKAWLEHGIALGLTRDHHPDAIVRDTPE